MKKTFAIVFAVAVLLLSACGEDPGPTRDEQMAAEEKANMEASEQAYYEWLAEEEYKAIEEAGAIDWSEAEDHIGEYVVVYGKVEEVSQPGVSGDPIFVDLGNAYPGDRVTGVCWEEYHSVFDDLFSYNGETVLMEGTLYMHEGTPNIELTDSFQIREAN